MNFSNMQINCKHIQKVARKETDMDVELLQSTHESVIGGALNYRELTKNWAIHSKSEQHGQH